MPRKGSLYSKEGKQLCRCGVQTLILDGIRILCLAYLLPGPYCTMLLGDLGAEVIIIEPPWGDPARRTPGYLSSLNRNKKGIVLNLKMEEGKQICRELAKTADVFLEGFRPGVTKKLGIDYDSIKKVNPQIIYCSISGFGQDGPYRDRPAHDLSYQGICGLLTAYGKPVLPNITIADLASGLVSAFGILVALIAHGKYGKGQYIDVAMSDTLVSLMSVPIGRYFTTGISPNPSRAGRGIFKTKDDRYITLSIAAEEHFWRNLCTVLGWGEETKNLSVIQRRELHEELNSRIAHALMTRNSAEWLKILTANDIPCGPVLDVEEVIKDPHILHRGMIREIQDAKGNRVKQVAHPIKYSDICTDPRSPEPELGEHTREILKSLGYSLDRIDVLRSKGVIK